MKNDGVLFAVLTEDVPRATQPLCSVGVAVSLPKQDCTLEEAEELIEDVPRVVPNRFKVSSEEGSMEWEKSAIESLLSFCAMTVIGLLLG
eukprot:6107315-Amphidinium_carterae.2